MPEITQNALGFMKVILLPVISDMFRPLVWCKNINTVIMSVISHYIVTNLINFWVKFTVMWFPAVQSSDYIITQHIYILYTSLLGTALHTTTV